MSIRFLSGINVDSNTLFVDDANNRVGIGTASPTQALDVTGRAYISSGASIGTTSTAGTGLTVNGSTVLLSFVEIQQGNLLYLYSSGNTYYSQIYQSGQNLILSPHSNVGIGTTSPSTKLEVVGGSVNTQIARFITADYPTHSVGLGVDAQSTYWGASIFQDDVKRFTVDSTGGILVGGNYQGSDAPANGAAIEGSVGIGTTSPSTKLDVIGTGVFGTMTTSRGSYSNGLSLQNNGGQATSLFLWQSGVASAHIGSPANSTSLHIVNSYNTGLITDPNAIVLDNTGNVGIGTTSPSSKLQSNTSSTYNSATPSGAIIASNLSGGNAIIDIGVDTSYLGYIQSRNILNTTAYNLLLNPIGGNVGIGTTSPNGALHVASSPQTRVVIENTGNDANGAGLIMTVRSSGTIVGNGGIYVDNSNNLILYNGGVYAGNERVRINNSGYVGINTTAPSSFLTVSPGGSGNAATFTSGANLSTNYVGITLNSVTTSGVEWYGSEIRNINTGGTPGFLNPRLGFFTQNASTYLPADRTEKMSILGNGNVGIGTTSPGFRLDVVGSDSAVARIYTTNSAQTISIGSTNQTQYTDIILPTDDGQGEIFRAGSGYSSYGGVRALNIWNSNGPIAFHPNNTGNVMYLSTTGNVGIGTTSPGAKLHVSGSSIIATATTIDPDSYANTVIAGNIADGSGWAALGIGGNAGTGDSWAIAHNGSGLYFGIQNGSAANTMASYMEVSPSRQITLPSLATAGFLKTNASGTLSVDTTAYVNGTGTANYVTKWSDSDTITNSSVYDDGTGDVRIVNAATYRGLAITTPTASARPTLTLLNTNYAQYGSYIQDVNGVIAFGRMNYDFGGHSEAMRITSAGNVGIGTTAPEAKLHVVSGASEAGILSRGASGDTWFPYTNGQNYVRGVTNFDLGSVYFTGGNVGIGTTSPGKKLDILQSSDSSYAINIGNSARYTYIGYSDTYQLDFGATGTNDNVRYGVFSVGGGVATFHTNGSERMRITSAGNVGIGTTSPAAKLHVYTPSSGSAIVVGRATGNSSIKASADADGGYLSLDSTGGATIINHYAADDVWLVTGGGNVGIGTSGPTQRVHVNGSVRVTGAYYDSNNSAGSSGQVLSSTGSGTDWVSLSEITGVDGTGTANYVAKWSDTDTITNSSITDNGTTVTATVDRLNMNKQAGIYVFSKTVGTSTTSDFFSISNSHGAQAFRVTFVCSTSGYSVAKTYEVVHGYGGSPVYNKIVDTGAYSGNDFDVVFADSNGSAGTKATVTNNSTTNSGNIVATVFLGGGSETITVTAL